MRLHRIGAAAAARISEDMNARVLHLEAGLQCVAAFRVLRSCPDAAFGHARPLRRVMLARNAVPGTAMRIL